MKTDYTPHSLFNCNSEKVKEVESILIKPVQTHIGRSVTIDPLLKTKEIPAEIKTQQMFVNHNGLTTLSRDQIKLILDVTKTKRVEVMERVQSLSIQPSSFQIEAILNKNSYKLPINQNFEDIYLLDKMLNISQHQKLKDQINGFKSLDIKSCLSLSSRKASILAAFILFSAPLAYLAYSGADCTSGLDKINQLFASATSKETFDHMIAPFAEEIGLPLIRSGCYVTSMFLGAQKVAQAVAALSLKLIPGAKSLETRMSEAFKRHLVRDVCLIIGLLGTGLLVEGIESDLNIYLQQLEINQQPLTLLMNGNFSELFGKMRSSLFSSSNPAVDLNKQTQSNGSGLFFIDKAYTNRLEIIAKTAIYSMKRMRLTPLKSYSMLEVQYGLPLSRLGITNTPQLSTVTQFFDQANLNRMATDFKNCLTVECLSDKKDSILKGIGSAYSATAQFMESPLENTKSIISDYASEVINRTMADRLYTRINNIKTYTNSFFN